MWDSIDIAPTGDQPFTDYSRWRLLVNDGGRHTWHYLRTEEELVDWPQNVIDRFWLGLDTARIRKTSFTSYDTNRLSFDRVYQSYRQRRMLWMQPVMGISSSGICSPMMGIGLGNMEARCFFFPVWLLDLM